MDKDIHIKEVFNHLSEDTFKALLKFMRLRPEERDQVLKFANELTDEK